MNAASKSLCLSLARSFQIGLLLLGISVCAPRPVAAQSLDSRVPEADLKSAYLLNLCKLTEWPMEKLEGDFVLGIWRASDFQKAAQSWNGQTVQGHPCRIIELKSAQDLKLCHAIFLGGPFSSDLKSWLAQSKALPVLTAGESESFELAGGMIEFVTVDSKLRFRINQNASLNSGLRISPAVLRLAVFVRKGEKP